MAIKAFILTMIFLLGELSCKPQDSLKLKTRDTLTIDQFDSLVNCHHTKMKIISQDKDSLTVEEAIALIKIENTLSFGVDDMIGRKEFESHKKKYISFDSCFMLYYIKKVIEKVEGAVTYGFGYYSERYNVLLGGHLTLPESYYYIRPTIKKGTRK
ncbi:MAG TPA: hypothetical protein VGP55_05640 [Chitinophagaceae bacterium]|nr:hypothetical protein [Chitinophagaceae bacterium]